MADNFAATADVMMQDARTLHRVKSHRNACYLAGYVVECTLKSLLEQAGEDPCLPSGGGEMPRHDRPDVARRGALMLRIADAWKGYDDFTVEMARGLPAGTFTCIRDIYGRCSIAVEGLPIEEVEKIKGHLDLREPLKPYRGAFGVQPLEQDSKLAQIVQEARRPLGEIKNAFVVERLLSNESWVRRPDKNPDGWPPVVAFYSFKGGVGRSAAAAMTAMTLAREGKRVALIDLDLEAPGIEGYFFSPGDPKGKVQAGVVDYLLEQAVLGESYQPDIDDFVIPYSDPVIAASGGSLVILAAGRVDETYTERLGRINLSEIGRKQGDDNPIRGLIAQVLAWRTADVILVDCRTGFTDLGGITLNGLSQLDVLVFRGGEADRRYLPIVLSHIQRFREVTELTPQAAERLARSFLIVYTMVEVPPKAEEAEQFLAELRRFTSEAVWTSIFERFSDTGYAYPSEEAQDSPLEPVPHDVILIPYMKDFFMVGTVSDMLRLQAERPERPYDALVRRLVEVKLPLANGRAAKSPPSPRPHDRTGALAAVVGVTDSAAGEQELATPEDIRQRFLPRVAYRTLLDPKAFIVLGRKGAGKSALFKLLGQPEAAQALMRHLALDARLAEKTRWVAGFAIDRGFPERDYFQRALGATGDDADKLSMFWRAQVALCLSLAYRRPIPGLAEQEDCISTLSDDVVQRSVSGWLTELDRDLEKDEQLCCVTYDDLDTGLTRDTARRSLLISALVDYWQQALRRLPRIRAKLFLREDIYNREVQVTEKSKVRDGIDRGTITWDGTDIYRALMKRLGHDGAFRRLLQEEGLWSADFDAMLEQPLGFIPPDDEDWLRKCVSLLAGETMSAGPSGYKKGYVYTWVLQHISDSERLLRPRNVLLLFSAAAKLQGRPGERGPLLDPRRFREALRGEVSARAVDDLRAEYKEEWSIQGRWLPDELSAFARVWPVEEKGLAASLCKKLDASRETISSLLDHMADAGLLERREWQGGARRIQIPDLYLFGLGLTRKG